MANNETLIKFGFVEDKNCLQLKDVFQNNLKHKEVYVDIYLSNPIVYSDDFMLLLRTHEKDVLSLNDDNRLILRKCDKYKTHIMNILFSGVSEFYIKDFDTYKEIILNVQNIYYKITILN